MDWARSRRGWRRDRDGCAYCGHFVIHAAGCPQDGKDGAVGTPEGKRIHSMPAWWEPTGAGWTTKNGWQLIQDGAYWHIKHWDRHIKTIGGSRRIRRWKSFDAAYRVAEKMRRADKSSDLKPAS